MARKICMLVGYYPINRGGAEYQSFLLANELKKQWDIFYISIGQKKNELIDDSGFRIYMMRTPKFMKSNAYFFLYGRIKKILKNENPDVVYQRVAYSMTGIAVYLGKKLGIKTIWHISHNKEIDNKKLINLVFHPIRWIENAWLSYGIKHADYIVAQSRDQVDLLKWNFRRNNAIICRNFHLLPDCSIQRGFPKKVVWVANLKRWKNPEAFVELALYFQSRKDTVFIMAGRSGTSKWSAKILDRIETMPNITYLGELKIEDVNKLLSDAYLFVNTSYYEGFPNTFIQAWLRGVPVLSLMVDPDHVLENHQTGKYAGDFTHLIKYLELFLNDETLRNNAGKKALEYAREYHSMRNISVITELLKSRI